MKNKDIAKTMTSYLLEFRRMQEKTEADFIASLGGLSLPQLNMLNIIGDLGTCTMGEVSKKSLLSLSSVTLIVDKLVCQQLVTRTRSETDRRIVYTALTPEGEKLYQCQIEHLQFVSEKMLGSLNEEEQQMLLQVLRKLTQATLQTS